jgi:hypothetical protein
MKKTILIILAFLAITNLYAQISKTVNCTAGNLSHFLTMDERNTVTNLTITGVIDALDFQIVIRNMGNLKVIDIKNTTIAPANKLPELALKECRNLTSVILPALLTEIGSDAFINCSSLSSITIPTSVTTIGDDAFAGCSGLLSITIPTTVTAIGKSAFLGCSGLHSIDIPPSLTAISSSAFVDCSGLSSITVPASVTTIGDYAFMGCSGLKSITIPPSVTAIGHDAFNGCSGLSSISIPPPITQIDTNVFFGCSGLNSITIPSSVTDIGYGAFSGCSGLNSITIPPLVTQIRAHAFSGCRSLSTFIIPSSVTAIGDSAFIGCSGLNSITIPSSVSTIGNGTFVGCSGYISVVEANPIYSSSGGILYDKSKTELIYCPSSKTGAITIPLSVKTINGEAFYGCNQLSSISIPASVTIIGSQAFESSSGDITVDDGNKTFSSADGILYDKYKHKLIHCPVSKTGAINNLPSIDIIESGAFRNCSNLSSITIPWTVNVVWWNAFKGCSGIISVEGGNKSYSSLDGLLYSNDKFSLIHCPMSKTGSINIPSSVNIMYDYAFQGCSGLSSIILPSSLMGISCGAFDGCSGLSSITIPSSVQAIGDYAFRGCSGLSSIFCLRGNPPSAKYAFDTIDFTACKIYVQKGVIKNYRYANGWKDFIYILEMDGLDVSVQNIKLPNVISSFIALVHTSTEYSVHTNTDWLSYKITKNNGIDALSISATANTSSMTRTATVTVSANGFTDEVITVTQAGSTITGVSDMVAKTIKVYPNPASNQLTVSGVAYDSEISIYDLNGRMIYCNLLTDNKIDISRLNSGAYIIKIAEEKAMVIAKFVKR